MPCRSDHLEPTNRERARKHAAELICYAYSAVDRTSPDWARAAANHVYGNPGVEVDVSGHLCDFLRGLDAETRDRVIYGNPRDPQARRLADWWEKHQEQDHRKALKPKFTVTLEIDQSLYLDDEDYTGIDPNDLHDPEKLARFIDKGCYVVTVKKVK